MDENNRKILKRIALWASIPILIIIVGGILSGGGGSTTKTSTTAAHTSGKGSSVVTPHGGAIAIPDGDGASTPIDPTPDPTVHGVESTAEGVGALFLAALILGYGSAYVARGGRGFILKEPIWHW